MTPCVVKSFLTPPYHIAGGYSSSATSLSIKDRFLGWLDDLAFYNRVLSPKEIAANWCVW